MFCIGSGVLGLEPEVVLFALYFSLIYPAVTVL